MFENQLAALIILAHPHTLKSRDAIASKRIIETKHKICTG